MIVVLGTGSLFLVNPLDLDVSKLLLLQVFNVQPFTRLLVEVEGSDAAQFGRVLDLEALVLHVVLQGFDLFDTL